MISVIIPVINEQTALPATLQALAAQTGDHETIIVDGGSVDHTMEIARMFPVKLLCSARGRARQMNAGARRATGDWLLFLHADTRLPANAVSSIAALDELPDVQAGGFRHRFHPRDRRLRCISWINNQRCARTRVFYGDQAPFIRRSLFERLGGFPEQQMLEDVLFMEKLTQITRPVLMDEYALTDSRRFRQHGVLRSFGRVFMILSCHRLGLRIPAKKFFAQVR